MLDKNLNVIFIGGIIHVKIKLGKKWGGGELNIMHLNKITLLKWKNNNFTLEFHWTIGAHVLQSILVS